MSGFSDVTPPLPLSFKSETSFWDWWLLGVIIGFLVLSIATYFIVYAILKPSIERGKRRIKCSHCGNTQLGFVSAKRNISFVLAIAFTYFFIVLIFVGQAIPFIVAGTVTSLGYTILVLIILPFLWLLELAVIIRSFPKTKAICPNCGHTWTF